MKRVRASRGPMPPPDAERDSLGPLRSIGRAGGAVSTLPLEFGECRKSSPGELLYIRWKARPRHRQTGPSRCGRGGGGLWSVHLGERRVVPVKTPGWRFPRPSSTASSTRSGRDRGGLAGIGDAEARDNTRVKSSLEFTGANRARWHGFTLIQPPIRAPASTCRSEGHMSVDKKADTRNRTGCLGSGRWVRGRADCPHPAPRATGGILAHCDRTDRLDTLAARYYRDPANCGASPMPPMRWPVRRGGAGAADRHSAGQVRDRWPRPAFHRDRRHPLRRRPLASGRAGTERGGHAPARLALRFKLGQGAADHALLDEARSSGAEIRLTLAAPGGSDQILFAGYLSHLRRISRSRRRILSGSSAADPAMVLAAEERVASYPDAADSDAASEIAGRYGYQTEIEDRRRSWRRMTCC